ncbi:MAG: RidA family protein [Thermoplasmata archaeon]
MNNPINVADIPKGGPYSHAIVTGNFIFLSGQTGNVPNRVLNFDQQFDNAMEKIKKILETAGASISDIVKISIYLAYNGDLNRMNDLFGRYFPNNPPARTTLVTGFASEGVLVEIDVIAAKDPTK